MRSAGSVVLCLAWVTIGLVGLIVPFAPVWSGLWMFATVGTFLWLHVARGDGYGRLRRLARARLRTPGAGAGRVVAAATTLLVAEIGLGLLTLHMGVKSPDSTDVFTDYAKQAWGWLPVMLALVMVAPIIEEIGFRGWMQRRLEGAWGAAAAIIVTAAVFSLAHWEAVGFLNRFVFGVAAGFIAFRAGSVWLSALFHAVSNFVVGLLILFAPATDDADVLRWIGEHGGIPALLAAIVASLAVAAWILRDLPSRAATPPHGGGDGGRAANFLAFGPSAASR
ncbi:MAG TPA: CPBP family intramembrane glutamic endopeptidase [Longimicrobium sp.]